MVVWGGTDQKDLQPITPTKTHPTVVEDGEFLSDTLQLSTIYGTAILYNTTNL